MTSLEFGAMLLIIAVIVGFVLWLALEQIRMLGRRADRYLWADDHPGSHVALTLPDGRLIDEDRIRSRAFDFPPREPGADLHGPIRVSFRRFLEGGPDYYHGPR